MLDMLESRKQGDKLEHFRTNQGRFSDNINPVQKNMLHEEVRIHRKDARSSDSLRVKYNNNLNKSSDAPEESVMQMCIIMSKPFGEPNAPGISDEQKDKFNTLVQGGLNIATQLLNNVMNNMSYNDQIKDYAKDVAEVLSDGNLEIYPMNKAGILGQAAMGLHQISLNVNLIKGETEMAKTLIHEAFHIIGGCIDIEEKECRSYNFNNILKKMKKEKNIAYIQADDFAQFVMLHQSRE